jgi:chemotaxis signal transduction protein
MHASLVIDCAGRCLALPLDGVIEVFRMVAMAAPVPRGPRDCLGLLDHRGRLVPAFDLAARLALRAARTPEQLVDGHLVLIADRVGPVAYAVDEAREIVEAEPEPLAAGGAGSLGRAVAGTVRRSDGASAPLIDPVALLSVRARQAVRQALEELPAHG